MLTACGHPKGEGSVSCRCMLTEVGGVKTQKTHFLVDIING